MRGLSPTIYQIASGSLFRAAAVSVVRISGPSAIDCFKLISSIQSISPRRATLTSLKHPNDSTALIDPSALALYFPAPHSFTGEDVVELHCHGNPVILKELFQALDSCNHHLQNKANSQVIQEAEAGEFTRRAFLNGKLDLTQVEGLADLLHAKTAHQKHQAIQQFEGRLGNFYSTCRQKLIDVLAHFEAVIDFADEEDDITEELVLSSVNPQVSELIKTLEKHLADNRRGEIMREGLQLTILGPPNAGKSSLLNALTQRDVAIVSDTAGTTRDILETVLDIEGFPVILSDTAGIRDTTDGIEVQGVKRAIERASKADLRVLVFDASKGFESVIAELSQEELSRMWKSPKSSFIIVLNKWDKVKSQDMISAVSEALNTQNVCVASCLEGSVDLYMFLDLLGKELKLIHTSTDPSASDHPIITRERHRKLLQETLDCLKRYQSNFNPHSPSVL